MSSDRPGKYPACDAAAMEGRAAPLLLIIEVFGPFIPSVVLRQGDKAQALTLRVLEETADVMDQEMHGNLQDFYHEYVPPITLLLTSC